MSIPAHIADYTSKYDGVKEAYVTKSVYRCLGEAPRCEAYLAWIITFPFYLNAMPNRQSCEISGPF